MSIYDYSYRSIEGKEIPLESYQGKVLLLVNTASKCGFTPQYEQLESIYKQYNERKFFVIGFPCDQFEDQEFDTNDEIMQFCTKNYGVTFPLSTKVKVTGEKIDPLFDFLVKQAPYEGPSKDPKNAEYESFIKARYGSYLYEPDIKWNFTKFLIDKQGRVVARYEPTTTPEEILPDILKLI